MWKCRMGEMSVRGNVLVGKCPVREVSSRGIVRLGNCPFGEMPIGGLSSGKCQSGNCPHTDKHFKGFPFTEVFQAWKK